MGFKTGMYILNAPKIAGMIAANTHMQLTQTTMREIKKVWKSIYNLTQYDKIGNPKGNYVYGHQPPDHFTRFEKFDNYHGIISFENGGIIFTASLVNYMAHDGKNIGWAELDETKDTKEDALKAVILARLSQPGFVYHKETLEIDYIEDVQDPENYINWNPCCINTSPSIGVVKWLTDMFDLETHETEILKKVTDPKDYFHLENENKSITISSTYHNAHNLSAGYIDNRLAQLSEGEALKFVFGYPFARTGNSFFRNFSKNIHVEPIEYRPELPISLSYDFNSKPYMTLLCEQSEYVDSLKELQIRIFKEYCYASPLNSTEAVSKAFIDDYGSNDPFVLFYGDASGDYRQAGSGDHTQFDTVRKELAPYISRSSDRVGRKNKNVLNRRDFVDRILERKLQVPYGNSEYTVVLLIDPSCECLIADMQWLKESIDGKLKEKDKDPETGEVYEKYGHCVVGETLISTNLGQKRIDEIEVGDMVLTRRGYKQVLNVFDNGIREVNEYSINGIKITCTPEHKFYTENKGFVSVCDVMLKDIICILHKNKQLCEKQNYLRKLMESTLYFIKTNIISKGGVLLMEKKSNQQHTDMSGILKKAVYRLKDFIFITKMKINQIIKLIISKSSHQKSMPKSTIALKESHKPLRTLRKKHSLKQWNGTLQKKGLSGTQSTQGGRFLRKNQENSNVRVAQKTLKQNLRLQNTAHTNVKLSSITIGKPQEKRVYDIQVDCEHEYFANGILVHNCSDALEYLLTEKLEEYYQK